MNDFFGENGTPKYQTPEDIYDALCEVAGGEEMSIDEAISLLRSLERCYKSITDAELLVEAVQVAIAAIRTLENNNYTYHGGEFWKPPLGKLPEYLLKREAIYTSDRDAIETYMRLLRTKEVITISGKEYTVEQISGNGNGVTAIIVEHLPYKEAHRE